MVKNPIFAILAFQMAKTHMFAILRFQMAKNPIFFVLAFQMAKNPIFTILRFQMAKITISVIWMSFLLTCICWDVRQIISKKDRQHRPLISEKLYHCMRIKRAYSRDPPEVISL